MVAIDMEMPKNCIFCPLYVGKKGEGHCTITHKWNATGGLNRLDDCPLVEIEEQKVEKLEKLEQILNNGSKENGISSLNAIRKVLESED